MELPEGMLSRLSRNNKGEVPEELFTKYRVVNWFRDLYG